MKVLYPYIRKSPGTASLLCSEGSFLIPSLQPAPNHRFYVPISKLPSEQIHHIRHRRPALLRVRFPDCFVDLLLQNPRKMGCQVKQCEKLMMGYLSFATITFFVPNIPHKLILLVLQKKSLNLQHEYPMELHMRTFDLLPRQFLSDSTSFL